MYPMKRALVILAITLVPFVSGAEETTLPSLTAEVRHVDTIYAAPQSIIGVTVIGETPLTDADVSVTLNGNMLPLATSTDDARVLTGEYTVTENDEEGPVELVATFTNGTVLTGVTKGDTPIIDVTVPTLMLTEAPPIEFEATQPEGSPVAYVSPASSDPSVQIHCEPASGANFTAGTTEVLCYAQDLAGNTSEPVVFLTVIVSDTEAPSVSLVGDATVTLTEGGTYIEQGVTVTDNGYTEFTYETMGAVDTEIPGTYTLTYHVTDGSGNTGSVTRTVTVEARPSSGGGGGSSSRRQSAEPEEEETGEVLAEEDEVSPTGEVLGASAYKFTTYLRQGAEGEEVRELQSLLNARGFMTHAPTGYFGPLTSAALAAFQSAYGLEPVGYVGPRTLILLNQGTVAEDPRIPVLLAQIAALEAALDALQSAD